MTLSRAAQRLISEELYEFREQCPAVQLIWERWNARTSADAGFWNPVGEHLDMCERCLIFLTAKRMES